MTHRQPKALFYGALGVRHLSPTLPLPNAPKRTQKIVVTSCNEPLYNRKDIPYTLAVFNNNPRKHCMKSTRAEYLNFFANWLHYQFPRNADIVRNVLITREVQKIVYDDSEAAYWGDRDCWSMHDLANKQVQARAIEGVTA